MQEEKAERILGRPEVRLHRPASDQGDPLGMLVPGRRLPAACGCGHAAIQFAYFGRASSFRTCSPSSCSCRPCASSLVDVLAIVAAR